MNQKTEGGRQTSEVTPATNVIAGGPDRTAFDQFSAIKNDQNPRSGPASDNSPVIQSNSFSDVLHKESPISIITSEYEKKALDELQGEDQPASETETSETSSTDDDDVVSTLVKSRGTNSFYFKGRTIHLTYSSHFDFTRYLNKMKEVVNAKGCQILYYSIVSEIGKTGHKHIHAAFHFNKNLTVTNCRFFDYQNEKGEQIHPHAREKLNKDQNYLDYFNYLACVYHKKSKFSVHMTNFTSVTGKSGRSIPDKQPLPDFKELQDYPNEHELVKDAYSRGHQTVVQSLLVAKKYAKDPKEKVIPADMITNLNSWQNFFIRLIEAKINDNRVVHWVYDQEGGTGKTALTSYLKMHHNACTFPISDIKSAMYCINEQKKKTGEPPPIIVIDAARDSNKQKDNNSNNNDKVKKEYFNGGNIYELIEVLKNGEVYSTKYVVEAWNYKTSPFIIVMSNSPPDISRLSEDRWFIHVTNYDGMSFDYGFKGKSTDELLSEYGRDFNMISKCHQSSQMAMDSDDPLPYKQLIEVAKFNIILSSGNLLHSFRKLYWDNHEYPTFYTRQSIQPSASLHQQPTKTEELVHFETVKMSESEIEEYEYWKEYGISLKRKHEAQINRGNKEMCRVAFLLDSYMRTLDDDSFNIDYSKLGVFKEKYSENPDRYNSLIRECFGDIVPSSDEVQAMWDTGHLTQILNKIKQPNEESKSKSESKPINKTNHSNDRSKIESQLESLKEELKILQSTKEQENETEEPIDPKKTLNSSSARVRA